MSKIHKGKVILHPSAERGCVYPHNKAKLLDVSPTWHADEPDDADLRACSRFQRKGRRVRAQWKGGEEVVGI